VTGEDSQKDPAEILQGVDEKHSALDRSDERQQAEREAAVEWLAAKWTQSRRCPVCDTAEWSIANVGEINLYGASELIYPVVPVICKNCAYTNFFQAIQMGIVNPEDPPDTE
jgi:predicted nucleic-acid-binding Zn-ribbon protein